MFWERRRRNSVLWILPFAIAAVLIAAGHVGAGESTIVVQYDAPTIDRWNYPFNPTPGSRSTGSVFTARPEPGFDDRDGQVLIVFDTAAEVDPALGASAYEITDLTLTVMVERNNSFAYDPTADPWQSSLVESHPDYLPDADPGARPVELFGVRFRNGWTLENYVENAPYCAGCDCFTNCVEVRNAYPIEFDPAGQSRDVSNNVRDAFDAAALAIGVIDTLNPGDLVPTRTDVTFSIDVENPAVQCYLRDGVDRGRLAFMITGLHDTTMLGSDGYPSFYMKEHINVPSTAQPARLEFTVNVTAPSGVISDITGDSIVNVFDLFELLGAWGTCGCCAADLDGSGAVDVFDLFDLLSHWTT